jgi:hypothetical protein
MIELVETRCAVLARTGPNEVEVRFRPGIVLGRSGIAEVIGERKRMCGDTSVGLLLIVPADTELDVAVIGTDHLKVNRASDHVLGFAVVAGSAISETLLRLYKAYYPPEFSAEVFTDEGEARTWLRKRVATALAALKR